MKRLPLSILIMWLVAVLPANLIFATASEKELGDMGIFEKWSKIEIMLIGPDSVGLSEDANPFEILVDVTFTGPGGGTLVLPAFYDGDGAGGLDGNVWKVRFSADETGTWTFASTSAESLLGGFTGSFTVIDPNPDAPDFYKWGRLEYVGTPANKIRYLKFRDGSYWLKAGCDDPENFLGSFSNYDTPAKRKSAVDYLAGKGVNSMYVLTHNIDGDNQDVWPWFGDTPVEAKSNAGSSARFDVAKLEEWLELFEYMQERGVAVYLVLEDDSAWTGYDHIRYYREMVARFGHLPALIFNLGEEYTEANTLADGLYFAQELKDIDPYDHPIAIHDINSPDSTYADADQVDFTSIQTKGTDPLLHNQEAIDWINRCKSSNKRVLMVGFDEPRPILDRKGWWSGYMGGGVWEVHVSQPYDRPIDTWETAWKEIGGARVFMEALPFWEMEPSNSVVVSGRAFSLAKLGEVYALYLPSGGTVTVDLTEGITYDYRWWNPANDKDGKFQNEGRVSGGEQQFTAPGRGDWALQIVNSDNATNNPPVASYGSATVEPGGSLEIILSYTDPDGPGPYSFQITQNPALDTPSDSGGTVTYTANVETSGTDTFKWKVNDGVDDSNEATVTVAVDPTPREICTDLMDNDDDGAVDCDDSDCAADAACWTCTDVDSDGYYAEIGCGTAVDCADNDPAIYLGAVEICDDNVDNDCGGAIDCADPDCQGDIACSEFVVIPTPVNYEVAHLQQDDTCYLDRDYTLIAIPAELSTGSERMIKTRNDDKVDKSAAFLQFEITHESVVYVAYDSRSRSLPSWLADNFETTSLTIGVSDGNMGHFAVYRQIFPADSTVSLGGNMASGAIGAGSNYIVIVQPAGPGAEICDNGGDDDEDGFVDLEDLDCPCTDADFDSYYAQSWCGTAVDCADNDAATSPGAVEICDDTVDNDCDGEVDCADSDCGGNLACSVAISTPSGYQVVDLQQDDTYYLDRDYTLTAIPAELSTGTERLIKTRNSDKADRSDVFLQFEITHESVVYVGYDSRARSLPSWLAANFDATSLTILVSDAIIGHFAVYQQTYPAGSTVSLGGNLASGAVGAGSNYIVIVQPYTP